MKCASCKIGVSIETTDTYFQEIGNCIVIIKNVPCLKCDQCGEVLFNTTVLKRIESIIRTLESVATEVSVVDYTKAA